MIVKSIGNSFALAMDLDGAVLVCKGPVEVGKTRWHGV